MTTDGDREDVPITDNLRDRIAAVIYSELRRQFDGEGIDTPLVAPAVGSNDFSGIALIDGEVNLIAAADAVIAELGLTYEPCYDDDQHRYVTDWED